MNKFKKIYILTFLLKTFSSQLSLNPNYRFFQFLDKDRHAKATRYADLSRNPTASPEINVRRSQKWV